jgi:asparagine synthase (glutamine-hydrolysing)
MCGVAGFIDLSLRMTAPELEAIALRMADTLAHRGPDDRGSWVEAEAGIALSHRRLAIIDLSPLGHQPMVSACGRYVISFNGEFYNFQDLRRELASHGHSFRGTSDTEVTLAAFTQWGVPRALEKLNGMFAFAVWDRAENVLYLARDPLGKKPMYFGTCGGVFAFASELKALRAKPAFHTTVNPTAVALYLQHGYVPTPHAIYENVSKLPPATLLTVRLADFRSSRHTQSSTYWSLRDAAQRGLDDPFRGSDEDAVGSLEELLRSAVALRMISDVPLGAFLSGGVDSSVIVALMQVQSSMPVRTFTIGFHEASHSEAAEAKAVSKWLGTEHTELFVSPKDALSAIPQLPVVFDEPFADSSQIPSLLVCRLTRRYVTVSLSGDGGDEVFGGYSRYLWGPRLWSAARRTPRVARRLGAAALDVLSPQAWDAIVSTAGSVLPTRLRPRHAGEKVQKLAESLRADTVDGMYLASMHYWPNAADVVLGVDGLAGPQMHPSRLPPLPDPRLQMMYSDTVGYLPDDILVKVDRASMAVGLEARAPLLDRRIVEFAWRLPPSLRVRGGHTKWILRQLLHKYVPRHLVDRPKSGFAVPIGHWLRTDLRDWAEALLDERRLQTDGLLRAAPIRKRWAEHLSGKRNWHQQMWAVLMLQAWLEMDRNTRSSQGTTGS